MQAELVGKEESVETLRALELAPSMQARFLNSITDAKQSLKFFSENGQWEVHDELLLKALKRRMILESQELLVFLPVAQRFNASTLREALPYLSRSSFDYLKPWLLFIDGSFNHCKNLILQSPQLDSNQLLLLLLTLRWSGQHADIANTFLTLRSKGALPLSDGVVRNLIFDRELSLDFIRSLEPLSVNTTGDVTWIESLIALRLAVRESDDAAACLPVPSFRHPDFRFEDRIYRGDYRDELEQFDHFEDKERSPVISFDHEVELFFCVYGHDYLRQLFQLALPSLINSGSLGALARRRKVRLVFYTTRESAVDLYEGLKALEISVPWAVNSTILGDARSAATARGYAYYLGYRRCARTGAVFCSMAPDTIYGYGIDSLVEEAFRLGAASTPHFRGSHNTMLEDASNGIIGRIFSKSTGAKLNRELVLLALTRWSHFFQRQSLNTNTHARRAEIENNQLTVFSTGHVILAFVCTDELIDLALTQSLPVAGCPSDRWLTLLDHWLLWHFAETKSLSLLGSDSYFLVESSYDAGYSLITRKIGFRPNHPGHEVTLETPTVVTLPTEVEPWLSDLCPTSSEFWRTNLENPCLLPGRRPRNHATVSSTELVAPEKSPSL
jgi:hypothetical protein